MGNAGKKGKHGLLGFCIQVYSMGTHKHSCGFIVSCPQICVKAVVERGASESSFLSSKDMVEG